MLTSKKDNLLIIINNTALMIGVLVIGWSIEAFFLSFLLEYSIYFILFFFNLATLPKKSGLSAVKRLEVIISFFFFGAMFCAFLAAQLMILDSFFGFQFKQQINNSNGFFSAVLQLISKNHLWLAALVFSCVALPPLIKSRKNINSLKKLKEYVHKSTVSLFFRGGLIMFTLIASAMIIFALTRNNTLDPRFLFVGTICMKALIEYKLLKKNRFSY